MLGNSYAFAYYMFEHTDPVAASPEPPKQAAADAIPRIKGKRAQPVLPTSTTTSTTTSTNPKVSTNAKKNLFDDSQEQVLIITPLCIDNINFLPA